MKMIITPNKFAILIEELVKTKKMSYIDARSEERRVGKEGRSGWSPYD